MAYVIGDDCIACGTCQGECPVEAISEGEKYSIDPDLCTECGTCASVCGGDASSGASPLCHVYILFLFLFLINVEGHIHVHTLSA